MLVIAPPESVAAPLPGEPTAEYRSIDVVRDTIEAILRRAVSPADTAIHLRRERIRFTYHYSGGTAPGWAFRVTVNDTTTCPHDKLLNALRAAGWANDWDYSADGPDGEDMGLVTRKFLCVMEAQWDGGDDVDTSYVPRPGCVVTVTCVPRRLDDVYPK